MNIETNHLATAAFVVALSAEERRAYTPVPPALQPHAERLLAGRNEMRVSRKSANPVAKWAAEKRRKRQKARRNARRANRS